MTPDLEAHATTDAWDADKGANRARSEHLTGATPATVVRAAGDPTAAGAAAVPGPAPPRSPQPSPPAQDLRATWGRGPHRRPPWGPRRFPAVTPLAAVRKREGYGVVALGFPESLQGATRGRGPWPKFCSGPSVQITCHRCRCGK
jgi:hypothetical protein